MDPSTNRMPGVSGSKSTTLTEREYILQEAEEKKKLTDLTPISTF